MITFDKNGNPQPNGILKYPYQEFKITFVDNFGKSKTRKKIFENYERYISDFKNEIYPKLKNWINGSFTTTKIDPNDIDIVNIVNHSEELNKNYNLISKFLTVGGSKSNYMVDGYFIFVYPINDPRYAITEQQFDYWSNLFGHDRENRPKALLEISID